MTPTAARRRFTVTAARTAVALVVVGVPVLVACGDTTERSAAAATSTTVAASSTMVAPAKRATAAEHLAKGLVDVSGSFAAAPSTEHVLLVGDSILRQTGPTLADELGSDVTVHNGAVNGSGLLTPDLCDWLERAPDLLAQYDPDVVVVEFIGNYTDEPGESWRTRDGHVIRDVADPGFAPAFGDQARRLMLRLAESDARVVWVLPPPMATDELQAVVDALTEQFQTLGDRFPQVSYADADDALAGPDGGYASRLPVNGRSRPVRTADSVHLTAAGQRALAQLIAPAVTWGGTEMSDPAQEQ